MASVAAPVSALSLPSSISLGGFALAVLATLLPWETGSIPGYSRTSNAWDDHAPEATAIVVVAGVGLAVSAAALRLGRDRQPAWWQRHIPVMAGALVAVLGAASYSMLHECTTSTVSGIYSSAIEIGAYLVIAGGIAAAGGALLGRR
jgi:hypothetical protein